MRRDHITSWILDTTRALVPAEGPGELDLVRSDFVVGPAAADGVPRPKTARELASSAISLGLGNYRVLISATAVVLVPTFVVGGAAFAYWRAKSVTNLNSTGSARTAEVAGIAVFVLGNLLAHAAGVHAATNLAAARVADWRQSLRVAVTRAGPVVTVGVTVGVLSGLGLLLFILPGVYLWFTWLVAMPVVVLERRTGRKALARSSYLVRGRWWSVFGGYLLVELFLLLSTVVVTVIVGAVFHASATSQVVAEQLASAFVELALAPVVVAFVAVTYLDLRLRKEGFSPAGLDRESDSEPDRAGEGSPPDRVWWGSGPVGGASPWQAPASPPSQPSTGPWWPSGNPREAAASEKGPERPPGWPAVSPKPPAPGQSARPQDDHPTPRAAPEPPDDDSGTTEESR
ncbi:MAG: glycerophosphoryl diester phosphodiesterase membrane domain-containing protein [Acidimicrobiales bacterium]